MAAKKVKSDFEVFFEIGARLAKKQRPNEPEPKLSDVTEAERAEVEPIVDEFAAYCRRLSPKPRQAKGKKK